MDFISEDSLEPSFDSTIHHLLNVKAEQSPNAVVIEGVGGTSIRYGQLLSLVDDVIKSVGALDLNRQDRVALVLPDGPETAAALLAVAAIATCAPLNPSYTSNEFDFYLSDLEAKALIVPS